MMPPKILRDSSCSCSRIVSDCVGCIEVNPHIDGIVLDRYVITLEDLAGPGHHQAGQQEFQPRHGLQLVLSIDDDDLAVRFPCNHTAPQIERPGKFASLPGRTKPS